MHAANGAERRAALQLMVSTPQMPRPVLLQGNTRVPPLLRTPVDEAVLTDIEVTASRAAVPFVRPPICQVLLKPVVGGDVERRASERHQLVEDRPLVLL